MCGIRGGNWTIDQFSEGCHELAVHPGTCIDQIRTLMQWPLDVELQ
jgi:hypothetical protein